MNHHIRKFMNIYIQGKKIIDKTKNEATGLTSSCFRY